MAGHGGRLSPLENQNRRDPSFVIPLSTSPIFSHRMRRVISSLRPYVLDENERTFGSYARRLFSHQNYAIHQRNSRMPLSHPTPHLQEQMPPRDEPVGNVTNIQSSSRQPTHDPTLSRESNNNDMVVISLGESEAHQMVNSTQYHQLETPTIIEPQMDDVTNNSHNSSTMSTSNSEEPNDTEISPELRDIAMTVLQYGMFFAIILAKTIFDRFLGLFILSYIFAVFVWCDRKMKVWTSSYSQTPMKYTMVYFFTQFMSVFLPYYHCKNEKLYQSALLMPPGCEITNLCDLLWIILITDYVLKMITVFVKMLITLLPPYVMTRKLKGNYFLIIEMISQLYRSLATVQPWLSYLLDSYQGYRKIFGIFLSASYLLVKGPDIIGRGINLHSAARKCLLSIALGDMPTQQELEECGGSCPICYDKFNYPTKLSCRHIFCERCIGTWLSRRMSCPVCRATITDDPNFRNGGTSHFIQLY